jgi:hypothetical protein
LNDSDFIVLGYFTYIFSLENEYQNSKLRLFSSFIIMHGNPKKKEEFEFELNTNTKTQNSFKMNVINSKLSLNIHFSHKNSIQCQIFLRLNLMIRQSRCKGKYTQKKGNHAQKIFSVLLI